MSVLQLSGEGCGADKVLPRLLLRVREDTLRYASEEVPQVQRRLRSERLPPHLHRLKLRTPTYTGEEKGSARRAVVRILLGARLATLNTYPLLLPHLLLRVQDTISVISLDDSSLVGPQRRSELNALICFFKQWLNSAPPLQYPLLYCVLSDTGAGRM